MLCFIVVYRIVVLNFVLPPIVLVCIILYCIRVLPRIFLYFCLCMSWLSLYCLRYSYMLVSYGIVLSFIVPILELLGLPLSHCMLCVVYCIVLSWPSLSHLVLYCIVLPCIVLFCIVLSCIVSCWLDLLYVVLPCLLFSYIVVFYIVLHCIVL